MPSRLNLWTSRLAVVMGCGLLWHTCNLKDEAEERLHPSHRYQSPVVENLEYWQSMNSEISLHQTLYGKTQAQYTAWVDVLSAENSVLADDISSLSCQVSAQEEEAKNLQRIQDFFLIDTYVQAIAEDSGAEAQKEWHAKIADTLSRMAQKDVKGQSPEFIVLSVLGLGLNRQQRDDMEAGKNLPQIRSHIQKEIKKVLKEKKVFDVENQAGTLTEKVLSLTKKAGSSWHFTHPLTGRDSPTPYVAIYVNVIPRYGAHPYFISSLLSAYGETLADQIWPVSAPVTLDKSLVGECFLADMNQHLGHAGFPWSTRLALDKSLCRNPVIKTYWSGPSIAASQGSLIP